MSHLGKYRNGFADVVANLPQPVLIVDAKFRIQYGNREAMRFFQQPIPDLLNTNVSALIDPEYWEHIRQCIDDELAGTVVPQDRHNISCAMITHDDGSKTPVQLTLVPIKNDAGKTDVLLRFDLQPLLLTRNNGTVGQIKAAAVGSEFLHALDVLEDPVVILDSKWRYHFVNQAGWNVLKRKREQVLGRVVWEFRPDLNNTEWKKAAVRAMKTQDTQRVEEYYPISRQWYVTNFFPSSHYLVCHMENVTALKETRNMNDQLLGSLEDAMDVYWSSANSTRRQRSRQTHTTPKRKRST